MPSCIQNGQECHRHEQECLREPISRDVFVPIIDISCRPACTVVLTERTGGYIPRELGSGLDRFLAALDRQPTEVGTKGLKVRSGIGNDALIVATFKKIRHIFIDFTLLVFGAALMENEINVLINISTMHSIA